MEEPGFETLCAHAGDDPTRFFGAPVPPIYQNSLFTLPDSAAFLARMERHPEVYDYTRVANPTTDVLEAKLAALERTEAARCFGSGMAAVTAAIFHAVRSGDHIVAVETAYGPTRLFLTDYLPRFNIRTTFIRGTDPEEFVRAARPETRLFYLESPSSLVFHLQDLPAVTALAREREIVTVIDNSWASPYFQNPHELGVDLVLHSATKYLGGHSDLVAGVVMGSRERMRELSRWEGTLLGGILDPFAAWLMLRGVRTLPVRMERHQQSALAVARFLQEHPKVGRVYCPGLPSHPQYELARRQLRGTSGLLSFELKQPTKAATCAVVDRLRYFGIAVSWGGFESLAIPITLPGPAQPERWGIRLHVGLETAEDLLKDLDQALAAVEG
ncbi:MAG: trans-sulfuration enzyme family protein [Armatimonadota bacterium]